MPNMDNTSTYDNIESSNEPQHPGNSTPYANTKVAHEELMSISETQEETNIYSEQQEEPNVYSTLTISNTTHTGTGYVQPEHRHYPVVIVCLCAVAGLVIPLLAPFVLYFLLRSRHNWRRGNYTKAYERANQAANLTIVCVVLFVMVLLIVVLAVGVVAFQHSTEITEITELLNITSEREHLERSKQILKSKLFHVITSSTTPTSLVQSNASSHIDEMAVNQSEHSFQTDESNVTTTKPQSSAWTSQGLNHTEVTTSTTEHTSEGLQHAEETTQLTPDVVDNFSDLHNKWTHKKLNSTHVRVHNPHLNLTHIRKHNFTLPVQ